MIHLKTLYNLKSICIAFCILLTSYIRAEVPAFDSDKPATTSFVTSYSQIYNTWSAPLFIGQWQGLGKTNFYTSTFIHADGYLKFTYPTQRLIYSRTAYTTPYTFTSSIAYAPTTPPVTNPVTTVNKAGIIIRANVDSIAGTPDRVQDPGNIAGVVNTATTFNREGIAIYPTEDFSSMYVQFSGVETGTAGGATPITKIVVPKLTSTVSLRDQATITVEDFGSSIYVYYNGARFFRIDLGGLNSGVYSSGTVYDADMVSKGTFTGMEVVASGKIAIAQRETYTNIRVYSVEVKAPSVPTAVNQIGSKFNVHQEGSSIIFDLNDLSGQLSVSIYNLQGKKMLTQYAKGGEMLTLNKVLKSGVYLVKVQGANNNLKTKLIVK
jgi:hypothetical protein